MSQKAGKLFEDYACLFLQRKGYRILERNLRTRFGEIDIVAEDQGTICFVEVKGRSSRYKFFPAQAVDRQKEERIKRVAVSYARRKPDKNFRFDIVSVVAFSLGEEYYLLKNVFPL